MLFCTSVLASDCLYWPQTVCIGLRLSLYWPQTVYIGLRLLVLASDSMYWPQKYVLASDCIGLRLYWPQTESVMLSD